MAATAFVLRFRDRCTPPEECGSPSLPRPVVKEWSFIFAAHYDIEAVLTCGLATCNQTSTDFRIGNTLKNRIGVIQRLILKEDLCNNSIDTRSENRKAEM